MFGDCLSVRLGGDMRIDIYLHFFPPSGSLFVHADPVYLLGAIDPSKRSDSVQVHALFISVLSPELFFTGLNQDQLFEKSLIDLIRDHIP